MTKMHTGAITTHVQTLDAVRDPGAVGEVPVVVFVHGLLTDSLASYYFTLGPAFAAAGIDVIMYDLRGHGRSDRPATGYLLEDFVGDLVGLLDALGESRPVHVVGNSFGGTVAAGLAAWHPERVATVTLIESEPPVPVWTEHIAVGLAHAKRELVRDEAIDWIRDQHGAHTARLSRGAGRILATTTLAEEVSAGRTIDAGLGDMTRPLLAIFGDESGLAAQQAWLEANVPAEVRVEVLAEQGHSVLVERPEETRELILAWVRDHALAGAAR